MLEYWIVVVLKIFYVVSLIFVFGVRFLIKGYYILFLKFICFFILILIINVGDG